VSGKIPDATFGIPAELSLLLKNALLQCAEFADDQALQAVFAHAMLLPWRYSVPLSNTLRSRVDAVIAQLADQKHVNGQNALVIFLQVLAENYDEADQLHKDLLNLAIRLAEFKKTGRAADELSQKQLDDTGQAIDREAESHIPPKTEQEGALQAVIDRLLGLWLWLYYAVVVIVAVIGFVSDMGQVFDLTLCTQRWLCAVLAFSGGVLIVGFSFLPRSQKRYKGWDRAVTAGLTCVIPLVMAFYANRACTNRCPSVDLQMVPKLIRPGEQASLTAYASDPENDPLVYYWESSLPGLSKEGGPYQSPQNQYTAPPDSWGKKITITVSVEDLYCGKKSTYKIQTLSVMALSDLKTPTPTSTPTPTLTPTPTSSPTPTPCSGSLTPCLKLQPHGCPDNMVLVPGGDGKFCTDTITLESPIAACGIHITMTKRLLDLYGYSLWEVEAYGPDVPGKNWLEGARADAKSVEGRYAYLAVDGKVTTRWDSPHQEDPQQFEITLVKPVRLDRIILKWEEAYAEEYCVSIIAAR